MHMVMGIAEGLQYVFEVRLWAAPCHLLQVVVLNDIHIDIMDYINPATVADVQFRSMWAEFEWENKVRSCFELRPVHCNYLCFCPPAQTPGWHRSRTSDVAALRNACL
jgi:Coatomer beta subunit appendage platform